MKRSCQSRKAEKPPFLLIHSCCAPCSSYVLEYLSGHFDIAVFYYNPNIAPKTEYFKRLDEQMRLIGILNADKAEKNNPGVPANGTSPDEILLISGDYDQDEFLKRISGLENEPEGGMRCSECYRMRLERTAQKAAEEGFDFFTTTLTVSPYKNADMLNEIGGKAAEKYNVMFLPSDFKTTATSGPSSCQDSTAYTARTTADAFLRPQITGENLFRNMSNQAKSNNK